MRKLKLLSLIIAVPFITGVILTVVGMVTKNQSVLDVGLIIFEFVVPALMFILVVVSIILMITGKLSDKPKNPENEIGDPFGTREKEHSDLEEINSTYGYENYELKNEYMIEHTAQNYKHAKPKEKILGWLFFGFLITDFVMIVVFFMLGIMIGAIICFCLFGGTIILSLIILKILQSVSINYNPNKSANKKILDGEVKACLMSSSTETGGITTRIHNVVYKVVVTSDNKDYTAYSKQFYEIGDKVTFAVIGKRRASIISSDIDEQVS